MESQTNLEIKWEEIFQIVKDLCDFGFRHAGTPPADKAESFIYEKLKEAGVEDVKFEKVNFYMVISLKQFNGLSRAIY